MIFWTCSATSVSMMISSCIAIWMWSPRPSSSIRTIVSARTS